MGETRVEHFYNVRKRIFDTLEKRYAAGRPALDEFLAACLYEGPGCGICGGDGKHEFRLFGNYIGALCSECAEEFMRRSVNGGMFTQPEAAHASA